MALPDNALVCGSTSPEWNWKDRAHEEETTNGVEAWVFALRGSYKPSYQLIPADFNSHGLVILNLDFRFLEKFAHLFRQLGERTATTVGLFEGCVSQLHQQWKAWSGIADQCDLIISINPHTTTALQALTATPVEYIGIPYPVDGIARYAVPAEEREHELFLCTAPLNRPLDYLVAKDAGLPMYGFERTFSRRLRELRRHKSLDKRRYVRQARELYADKNYTLQPALGSTNFLQRTPQSLAWVNIDTRYTWARYVLDAAALGMPIITTTSTGHGPTLFPETTIESPYDIASARKILARLLDDKEFYRNVAEHAQVGLAWYRPEAAVARLQSALALVL